MRGRKPKPTALKMLEGNPGRRPLNVAEPRPMSSMPDPPPHLNADALEEWERVVNQLHGCRVITQLDRPTLAAYCQAYGRWVQAERALAAMAARDAVTSGLMIKTSNGNAIQNPLVGTANKAAADMVRFAAEFGMTPSARSRIVVGHTASGPSRFGDLIGPVPKPWEWTGDDDPASRYFD